MLQYFFIMKQIIKWRFIKETEVLKILISYVIHAYVNFWNGNILCHKHDFVTVFFAFI